MGLTVKSVEKLKQQRRGRHADGHGLYLQVLSPTNHSWLFRYERKGVERWMGLGPLHAFTLEEARARARKARQMLADGIDPLTAKRQDQAARTLEAAKAVTFETVAMQYFDAHSASWSNAKHRQQFSSTMRDYVYPVIGKLPVSTIDESMVLAVLRPIWLTKNATARRVRNRIASVLDYASASKYRSGTNPARWEGHLEHLLAAPEKLNSVARHHAALPYTEVAAFMCELRTREDVGARALEFTILTAARSGEVLDATWDEFDFKQRVWTIPAARMKAGKEHKVPLSDAAVALLRSVPTEEHNPHVFIGATAGSRIGNIAMHRTIKALRPDITVHGFRSTFRDWAAERTNYPNHVVEMALAHSISDKVEAAYRRGDLLQKRTALMADWARFCTTKPNTETNITPLRRTAHTK